MYPIRIHLLCGDSADRIDRDRLHTELTSCRSPDGTTQVVRVRCRREGPDIHMIAFVAAPTPEAAVAICQKAVGRLTGTGGMLNRCLLARCSLGFGAVRSVPGLPRPRDMG